VSCQFPRRTHAGTIELNSPAVSLLVERFKPQRMGFFGRDAGLLRPGFGGAGTQPGPPCAASAFGAGSPDLPLVLASQARNKRLGPLPDHGVARQQRRRADLGRLASSNRIGRGGAAGVVARCIQPPVGRSAGLPAPAAERVRSRLWFSRPWDEVHSAASRWSGEEKAAGSSRFAPPELLLVPAGDTASPPSARLGRNGHPIPARAVPATVGPPGGILLASVG
jgi:hypothetical protein